MNEFVASRIDISFLRIVVALHVSISRGFVAGADVLVWRCLTAAVTAIYVIAAHLSVAQYLSVVVNVSPVHGLNAAASLSANGVAVA